MLLISQSPFPYLPGRMEVYHVDLFVRAFPPLEGLDLDSTENKLYCVLLGIVLSALFSVICYLVSFSSETFRRNLRTKEKVFWCLALVRALFGFFGMAIGAWFVLIDRSLHVDVVNGINVTSFISLHLFIGFFIFECSALYISNIVFRFFDPFLAAHHTLSLLGGCMVAYYGKGHFFAIIGLLLEMTTPFSCLCWILIKMKLSHHWTWKLNQLILVHLFHCRTTVEAFVIHRSYFQWDNITANLPTAIFVLLYTQVVIQFLILTPYWTYKKMLQLSNPVDWNHPELDKQAVTNGVVHEHKD